MTDKSNLSQKLAELNQTLKLIDNKLRKMGSLRHNFFLAIVQGLGIAIGGTLILSLVLALVVRALSTISQVPVLDQAINQQVIEQLEQAVPGE